MHRNALQKIITFQKMGLEEKDPNKLEQNTCSNNNKQLEHSVNDHDHPVDTGYAWVVLAGEKSTCTVVVDFSFFFCVL